MKLLRALPLLLLPFFCVAPVGAEDDAPPVDYLIVTANDLHEAAREWAEYRAEHGRVAVVLRMSDIAAVADEELPGVDEIRRVINRFARPGDELTKGFEVLLLGAVPEEGAEGYNPAVEIPWQMTSMVDANANPERRRTIPTDNVYANLLNDNDDMPNIAVGRIPARTLEQARVALEKVRAYEAATPGEWLRRLTYFAGEGRFGTAVDTLLENLFGQFVEDVVPPEYAIRMTYANINSSYAYAPSRFSRKVIDEANTGALMLTYMGHGLHDRLDNMYVEVDGRRRLHRILQSEDVKGFDIEGGKLPIMLILACRTGALDHADGCLSEAVCFAPRGPVAVISSSRDSHPYSNILLKVALTNALCGQVGLPSRTLGSAFMHAKRELSLGEGEERRRLDALASLIIPARDERNRLNRTHIAMYNLVGDPGLRLHRRPFPLRSISAKAHEGGKEVSVEAFTQVYSLTRSPFMGSKVEHSLEIHARRTVIPGELEKVNLADLVSGDEERRSAAEDVLARNHEVANTRLIAQVDLKDENAVRYDPTRSGAHRVFVRVKLDRPLAPGEYILKLSARDESGALVSLTPATLKVEETNE
jgi:hypothetical protein